MQLIGRYISPFVRRVATTLNLYDIAYEHLPLSTMGEDRSRITAANPVTRVPALVLDDGEVLLDSSAIIDHLDQLVGPECALTPAAGAERRKVLKLTAVANGAAEKAVLTVYEERFRPPEKWHAPWTEMCGGQARDGLRWLNGELLGPWLTGDTLTQADVATVCCLDFIQATNKALYDSLECAALADLCERANALPAFKSTQHSE